MRAGPERSTRGRGVALTALVTLLAAALTWSLPAAGAATAPVPPGQGSACPPETGPASLTTRINGYGWRVSPSGARAATTKRIGTSSHVLFLEGGEWRSVHAMETYDGYGDTNRGLVVVGFCGEHTLLLEELASGASPASGPWSSRKGRIVSIDPSSGSATWSPMAGVRPRWSPDGTKVASVSELSDSWWGLTRQVVVEAWSAGRTAPGISLYSGGTLWTVTGSLLWSPDGTAIAAEVTTRTADAKVSGVIWDGAESWGAQLVARPIGWITPNALQVAQWCGRLVVDRSGRRIHSADGIDVVPWWDATCPWVATTLDLTIGPGGPLVTDQPLLLRAVVGAVDGTSEVIGTVRFRSSTGIDATVLVADGVAVLDVRAPVGTTTFTATFEGEHPLTTSSDELAVEVAPGTLALDAALQPERGVIDVTVSGVAPSAALPDRLELEVTEGSTVLTRQRPTSEVARLSLRDLPAGVHDLVVRASAPGYTTGETPVVLDLRWPTVTTASITPLHRPLFEQEPATLHVDVGNALGGSVPAGQVVVSGLADGPVTVELVGGVAQVPLGADGDVPPLTVAYEPLPEFVASTADVAGVERTTLPMTVEVTDVSPVRSCCPWRRSDEVWAVVQVRDAAATVAVSGGQLRITDQRGTELLVPYAPLEPVVLPLPSPGMWDIAIAYEVDGIVAGQTHLRLASTVRPWPGCLTGELLPATDTELWRCIAGTYADVDADHHVGEAIGALSDAGVVGAYGDGGFHPAATVTRQAAATWLHRLAGSPGGEDPSCVGAVAPDVAGDHRFCGEIAWMVVEGLTSGYPDGGIHPAAPVSRQALVAWLWRRAGEPTADPAAPTFTDVPSGHPFHDAVAWAAGEGVVTGYDDGTFRPASPVTRQAAAAVLWRAERPAAS